MTFLRAHDEGCRCSSQGAVRSESRQGDLAERGAPRAAHDLSLRAAAERQGRETGCRKK
eukprot:CAMPEP_0176225476 /NCGR_PEP_ID=MMETSP0121_2-20121125/21778_1 /TAXON_ID=160619 /ORGANISM="Kryptoperidinium foliaceum, Strain CCMP 1326" /LENGTH=58 /DNA_ID=CAMNT_0017564739 /DNA_START=313 /DNA_END=486 /DNA_ORIENTATION=-